MPYRRHSRDAQASVSASSCGKYTTHCTDQESNYCLLSISPIGDHFLREIMSGSGAAKILNAREKGHSIPVCNFIRDSSLQHCDKYPGVPSHSSRVVLWTRYGAHSNFDHGKYLCAPKVAFLLFDTFLACGTPCATPRSPFEGVQQARFTMTRCLL